MPPIIRRTIMITITETWSITWPDGRETSWAETHEVCSPTVSEPSTPRLPLIDVEEREDGAPDPDAVDPTTSDRESMG